MDVCMYGCMYVCIPDRDRFHLHASKATNKANCKDLTDADCGEGKIKDPTIDDKDCAGDTCTKDADDGGCCKQAGHLQ